MTALGRLFRRLTCESGAASLEFVIAFPVILTVVISGFESGLLLSRKVMIDRAVDLTVRELRLTQITNPTHQLVKERICAKNTFVPDCLNVLRLELEPIATTGDWSLPTLAPDCVDRSAPINPPEDLNRGGENELMLIRVCVVADPVFPNYGLGLYLPKDDTGGVRLISTSAFVNEPRPAESNG
ncbi:TadE-like protein [Cereibacter ovatus]|uniref:TadE-like protein n=1 Tax=Cereibacter ovatus TaxID=439529 RepID=A0A285CNX1_9RHOB|nr:TadE family protein [Cereibacter ovatus]SNX69270.1 TadE-like protein [Cereibacter ovatus]